MTCLGAVRGIEKRRLLMDNEVEVVSKQQLVPVNCPEKSV